MNKGKFTPAWRHKKLCGRDSARWRSVTRGSRTTRKIELFESRRRRFLCTNKCYNSAYAAAAGCILISSFFPIFVSKYCSLLSFIFSSQKFSFFSFLSLKNFLFSPFFPLLFFFVLAKAIKMFLFRSPLASFQFKKQSWKSCKQDVNSVWFYHF